MKSASAWLAEAAQIGALAIVPVALVLSVLAQMEQTALLTMLVAVGALVVFFAGFEASRPPLRMIMPTVVLAALAVVGRVAFSVVPIPDFKPVSAICIIAGVVFGRRSGFMVGALAALGSNFFLGQGPWTPWQMYGWGLMGYVAGVLGQRGWLDGGVGLYVYGALAPLGYGLIVNAWYVLGFVNPLSWPGVLAAFAAAFPFDALHSIATVLFLLALFQPWKRKLLRIKRKYDLIGEGQRPKSA